jgi:hypothetical protein
VSVFNPITGQWSNETDQLTAHQSSSPVQSTSSVRVRQPPGGVSSKLW